VSEPKYGEPWRVAPRADKKSSNIYAGSVTEPLIDGRKYNGSRLIGEIQEFFSPNAAKRIAACINLLAQVPDDAACFQQYKSDETQLALAVLAGDHGAAAALADEVISKYAPPVKPRQGSSCLGYFKTFGEFIVGVETELGRQLIKGEFKGLFQSSPMTPLLRWVISVVHNAVVRVYNRVGYPGRTDLFINMSYEAGRALLDSAEFSAYYMQTYGHIPPTQMYGIPFGMAEVVMPNTPDLVIGYKPPKDSAPLYPLIIQNCFE